MKAIKRARRYNAPKIRCFSKRDIIRRDGLNCYLCGELLTYETATIDHIKPLSRGGNHTGKNAKIACQPCNSKKGNMTLEEFFSVYRSFTYSNKNKKL